MMKRKQVRPIAICVFRKDDMTFVAEGYDPADKETFYRPLGGEIEFGEYRYQTIVREIREEIGAEIKNLRYLTTIENIFTYNGQQGHEVVLVYEGEFQDRTIYEKETVKGRDDGETCFEATWTPLADFQSRQAALYPEGLLRLLMRHPNRESETIPT
jgi:8-oxo-dGTP pyrophosphatase MutT (NUDIX family)